MAINEKKIKKAINGDQAALEYLLHQEKEKVYRTAYSYVGNETDALDVFQQTVLRAIENIHQLREPRFFSTWLIRICINASIELLRKRKETAPLDEVQEHIRSSEIVNPEEKMDLLHAIYQLDEKYKTVLLLKYYEDLTFEQIAQLLGQPIGTVKSNVKRALEKIKPMLKGVYTDERRSIY